MLSTLIVVTALVGQRGVVDNVAPRIGYVYPPGGRIGTTVDVMIGGYDWTPDMEVFSHDPRVQIELVGPPGEIQMTPPPYVFGPKAGEQQPPLARESAARISLPKDLSPGVVRFQAANANGGTAAFAFHVGEAGEVVEPAKPTGPIALPSLPAVANGRLSKITEIDEFTFTADKAGLTVCRLDDRVGQSFNGVLTILDAATGRRVADDADTAGRGAVVRFVAEAGKKYVARVNDLDHAGDRGYDYRLSVAQTADVVTSLPAVVGRGAKTQIEIVGWGVKTGAVALESVTETVAVPKNVEKTFRHTFKTPAGPAVAVLAVGESSDTVEPASDDVAARALTVPVRLTGAFDKLDEQLQQPVERYRLTCKKGEAYRLRVLPVAGAPPIDAAIAVVGPDGVEISRNDDMLVGVVEPALDFKPRVDGEHEIVVLNASAAEPSRAVVYRLLVDDATTSFDFDVTVPEFFNVPLGEQADLVVKTSRLGVWTEDVAVRFEELPPGVTVPEDPPPPPEPVLKPGQKAPPKPKKPAPGDVKKTLVAAADAAAGSRLVTVVATATVGDRTLERRAGPVLVTAKMKYRAIVRSAVQDGGRIVNRGTTYPAEVFIDRYEGYDGPVTLVPCSTQSRQRRGIIGPTFVVKAGVDRALYPVHMPEWLETSLTARQNLMTVVEVADPRGNKRFVTGTMDGQIVMSMEGALIKTTHDPQERRAAPGTVIEIPVKVSRTPKLQRPAHVELVPDADEPELFTAEPVELSVKQTTAVLKVRIAKDVKTLGLRHVVIRATALQDGKWPAASETGVPLILETADAVATAK